MNTAPPTISNLRSPPLAALLAWLIPGAGHLFQGRTAKGILFMVCILGTFFYGLAMGNGKVVYASWQRDDIRWAYFCQIGVGLPALPALFQAERSHDAEGSLTNFMAPPGPGELAAWHKELGRYFELGTVYTMIAGLLNLLAIYDAFAGPVPLVSDDRRKDEKSGATSAQPA